MVIIHMCLPVMININAVYLVKYVNCYAFLLEHSSHTFPSVIVMKNVEEQISLCFLFLVYL